MKLMFPFSGVVRWRRLCCSQALLQRRIKSAAVAAAVTAANQVSADGMVFRSAAAVIV
jgi:hypothetical protein